MASIDPSDEDLGRKSVDTADFIVTVTALGLVLAAGLAGLLMHMKQSAIEQSPPAIYAVTHNSAAR